MKVYPTNSELSQVCDVFKINWPLNITEKLLVLKLLGYWVWLSMIVVILGEENSGHCWSSDDHWSESGFLINPLFFYLN